jgi:hypothetical protein
VKTKPLVGASVNGISFYPGSSSIFSSSPPRLLQERGILRIFFLFSIVFVLFSLRNMQQYVRQTGLYLIINYTVLAEKKDYLRASLSLFLIGKFQIHLKNLSFNILSAVVSGVLQHVRSSLKP